MNLKQFAKKAGVIIVSCEKEKWGGAFTYTPKDDPSATVCGYKTEDLAYRGWLECMFGNRTSKSLMALMEKAS